ncbi:MAG: Eco57I restriction-modification methylase domain-containing protein [Capsulimonadaceae bacterium]
MINRLMFVYFIQAKGFLDANHRYLRANLDKAAGNYYRDFLCPLFFAGFAKREAERTPDERALLGRIPYLNGGLFNKHPLEEEYGDAIRIENAAFVRLFVFFDSYNWYLDDRPLATGKDINPDVLGYIFEKYINQKQMGAYYTKEDITEYIAKNTIIPFIWSAAKIHGRQAFDAHSPVWNLLQKDPNAYIYAAVKKGVDIDLPADIEAGIDDVSRRGGWNHPAPAEFALPTEIWREVVARRQRYEVVRAKLAAGEVRSVDDLITLNLDIRQFAEDVVKSTGDPDVVRAVWYTMAGRVHEIKGENATPIAPMSVLDPTCGSGAFLFAALGILEPLYKACLGRMEEFVARADTEGSGKCPDFRRLLERVHDTTKHPNRAYFVLKTIILGNLYGVDIMPEAIEICKLRLFLKMASVVEPDPTHPNQGLEPLPDVDFNVRSGNTLVGFATHAEVKKAVFEGGFHFDGDPIQAIDDHLDLANRCYHRFVEAQMRGDEVTAQDKADLRRRLGDLDGELNGYLARQYGVDPEKEPERFDAWVETHQPFHWFVEFFGIMNRGGFDAIIGNPPYVEKSKVTQPVPRGIVTKDCRDMYAWVVERTFVVQRLRSRLGLIVPISVSSSESFESLREVIRDHSGIIWLSHFSNRPGQLFEGAQNRLAILLGAYGSPLLATTTTQLLRWDGRNGGRGVLFYCIRYGISTERLHTKDSVAKAGDSIAMATLARMNRIRAVQFHLVTRSQQYPVYWVRVPGYFCQFYLNPPMARPEAGGPAKPRGELNQINALDAKSQRIIYAVLNSTCFYFYYCTYTDVRHINPTDVKKFPFDLASLPRSMSDNLLEFSAQLEKATNQGFGVWRKSGLLIDSLDSRTLKPIIDEIDRVLAKHYGFTDEELDFIINYDIKYRMGLTGDGEPEDEE